MATTATLTGTFTLPNDAAPESAVLSVTLSAMDTDQNTGHVLPDDGSFTIALVAGAIPAGQTIWQNTAGLRGTHYRATLAWTASDGRLLSRYLGSFQVGEEAEYDMADLLDQPPIATLPEGWYSTLTQGDYDAAITARDEAVAAALATAADRVQTGLDAAAAAADRVQTGLDAADAKAFTRSAETARDEAQGAARAAADDALATAADRVQTGLDATATGADRVQTGLDVSATAADRVQTGLDRTATGADRTATAADRLQTGLDATATAADRVQTGLDATATAADRVQTGLDRNAAALSASQAALYDGPWLDTVSALIADTSLTYTAAQPGTVSAGDYVRTRSEGFAYQVAASGASDHHITTAGGVKLYVVPGQDGRAAIGAFGCRLDGVADDTAAVQAALDSGLPLSWPDGEALITDSLRISRVSGCSIDATHRTVANTAGFPRLHFNPPSKRDLFVWDVTPTSYVFGGVEIRGLSIRGGSTAGGDAVFNLPFLYRGRLDVYVWVNFDHFARVEAWLDCKVSGNINSVRVSGFEIVNPTLSGSRITTRTDFDVYISGGGAGTCIAYDIGTFAIIGARIGGIAESTDTFIRMARGNTVDCTTYTENIPRTNAGAWAEIGKIDDGAPDGTTVFTYSGVNLHGRNSAEVDYSNTVFADIDHCSSFFVSEFELKRFGALLATTANSNNIVFANGHIIGVTLLELTTTGIADFSQLSFEGIRAFGMSSPHGNAFPSTVRQTTALRNPQGAVRPRWAGDEIRSTTSNSLWVSTGDGLFDWRLSAPLVSVGEAAITPPATMAAGESWQAAVTTFGALAGDFSQASIGGLNAGLAVSSRVTAADTVTVTIINVTASPISTTAATCRTFVIRQVVS